MRTNAGGLSGMRAPPGLASIDRDRIARRKSLLQSLVQLFLDVPGRLQRFAEGFTSALAVFGGVFFAAHKAF